MKKLYKIEAETDPREIYKHLADLYAEKHGIIEYHIEHNKMIYYTSFPYEKNTYKVVVNLDTNKETRTLLKGYYKAYKSRVGGKYQSNYMA